MTTAVYTVSTCDRCGYKESRDGLAIGGTLPKGWGRALLVCFAGADGERDKAEEPNPDLCPDCVNTAVHYLSRLPGVKP